MIRSVGVFLVIWGLIVQPLMAGMSAPMADNSPHSSIASDSGGVAHAMRRHDDKMSNNHRATCHENAADDVSSEPCDNCGMGCMNGTCASCCAVIGAAVIWDSSVNLDLLSSSFVAVFTGARAHRLPSRIFHPPKQA